MQKKFNLKSFNLYEYLKHQNAHSFNVPFFLADRHTYQNAHVNFPFRTFAYGLGITYTGEGDVFKIGSTDYSLKAQSLTTLAPEWFANGQGITRRNMIRFILQKSYLKGCTPSHFYIPCPSFSPVATM